MCFSAKLKTSSLKFESYAFLCLFGIKDEKKFPSIFADIYDKRFYYQILFVKAKSSELDYVNMQARSIIFEREGGQTHLKNLDF